jgi:endonuclease IV
MIIIGSHVSFGKDQLLTSVKEAISYNSDTFMFYTGAPQNTIRKDIDLEKTKQAQKLMLENNIDINKVICHAPYIVNPASNDSVKQEFAISFLKEELRRCNLMGIKQMVLHPVAPIKSPESISFLKKSYFSSPTSSILNSNCKSLSNSLIRTNDNLPILRIKIIRPQMLTSVVPSLKFLASFKVCVLLKLSGYGLHTLAISFNFSLLTISCSVNFCIDITSFYQMIAKLVKLVN